MIMILKFLHGFSYTPHCEIIVLSLSIFGKKYKSDVRIKALDILKKHTCSQHLIVSIFDLLLLVYFTFDAVDHTNGCAWW